MTTLYTCAEQFSSSSRLGCGCPKRPYICYLWIALVIWEKHMFLRLCLPPHLKLNAKTSGENWNHKNSQYITPVFLRKLLLFLISVSEWSKSHRLEPMLHQDDLPLASTMMEAHRMVMRPGWANRSWCLLVAQNGGGLAMFSTEQWL